MFKLIAIGAGIAMGVACIAFAGIVWWLGYVFKDWDWDTW